MNPPNERGSSHQLKLAEIVPIRPRPLTLQLCHNYLMIKNFYAFQLSLRDRRALGYIEHFIKHGGLVEGQSAVEANNAVLERILQRVNQPSRWRRIINWLNAVEAP